MKIGEDPDMFQARKYGNAYALERIPLDEYIEIKKKKRIEELEKAVIDGKIAEQILKGTKIK